MHAHSRLASGKCTYDKRNNTRIMHGGVSGAVRYGMASPIRPATLNIERKKNKDCSSGGGGGGGSRVDSRDAGNRILIRVLV